MTSQVNPNNIDGTYPVAGQDNDSQGFRDNFTNIRNNLTFAKTEIEDLQNKAVLKSALNNTTLNNDLAGNVMINPSFKGWRESYNNVGAVSGSTTIDFANGNYQKITLGGATTLAFTFPSNAANQNARIVVWINVSDSAHTVTLPAAVTLGDKDTIAGISGSVITFSADELANSNDYFLEFSTVDSGTTIEVRDLTRNRAAVHSGLAVTGNLTVNDGQVNTNYAYHTVATGDNLFVNNEVNTYHIDTTDSDTIANLYVTVPDSAPDGHELKLSFHAPVTSLVVQNVSANVAGAVKWVPTGTVSSGNVAVNLNYSTGVSAWIRS
jgi:hypothetical protein